MRYVRCMTNKRRGGPPLKEETFAVRVSPAMAKMVLEQVAQREVRVSDWLREAIQQKLLTDGRAEVSR